jgi:hypothetical protein
MAKDTMLAKPLSIAPLNMVTVVFDIEGTEPFMQARFSHKAKNAMMAKMRAGTTAKGKKVRDPRDFDADYEAAMYRSADGWCGHPASAFRAACISACRLVGFKMTLAKLSVFIVADGYDALEGTPLVMISGTPEKTEMPVRNQTGVFDVRARPMWRKWGAKVRVRFDADQFTPDDVFNLMMRVGQQVGIGEGRPDSKDSAGLGYGTFLVKKMTEVADRGVRPVATSAARSKPVSRVLVHEDGVATMLEPEASV